MSAEGFVLETRGMLKLNVERGATVRVRSGCAWLTQPSDPKDHILNPGDTTALNGAGGAIVTALEPTLLELYRQDPVAVREQVRHRARRARSGDIRAFFARLFR